MFWQEDPQTDTFSLPDDVQDASFNIRAKILPIDHSFLLKRALLQQLPWLESAGAGIFDISIADGNGWIQDPKGGFYYPSKRSKLVIRLHKNHLNDATELLGKTLNLGEFSIKIIKVLPPKLLSDRPVLFAKNIVCNQDETEDEFLQRCFAQLSEMGISVKKMMAGLSHTIATDGDTIHTRSLMIADLSKRDSVHLQARGLGEHRLLGCGLFLPQKNIDNLDGA